MYKIRRWCCFKLSLIHKKILVNKSVGIQTSNYVITLMKYSLIQILTFPTSSVAKKKYLYVSQYRKTVHRFCTHNHTPYTKYQLQLEYFTVCMINYYLNLQHMCNYNPILDIKYVNWNISSVTIHSWLKVGFLIYFWC